MTTRRGFTLIELLIAILFAGTMITIATRSFGAVRTKFAAEQGLQVFQSLHARARASAIETGTVTRLLVDVAGDSVSIVRGGVLLETIHFDDELGVDVLGTSLRLCMGPRGFAITDCNSFNVPTEVAFRQGVNETHTRVLPLGQLVN